MKLIVIGQANDPHVSSVVSNLDADFEVCVFDIYNQPRLDVFIDDGALDIRLGDVRLKRDEPVLAWFRVKPPMAGNATISDDPDIHAYAVDQWKAALHGLTALLPNSVCVNPIGNSLASNKVAQLGFALESGFEIPATSITNVAANQLVETRERVAFKALKNKPYKSEGVILTQLLDRQQLFELEESLRVCPVILQTFVQKSCELRVGVFGDQIEAVKIHARSADDAMVDWRQDGKTRTMTLQMLTREQLELIRRFMTLTNLNMGMFDLIVDKDGRTIFLECNPDGQWLGFCQRAGLNWSKYAADMFLHIRDRVFDNAGGARVLTATGRG